MYKETDGVSLMKTIHKSSFCVHGLVIGAASANSIEFHGSRLLMYIEDLLKITRH